MPDTRRRAGRVAGSGATSEAISEAAAEAAPEAPAGGGEKVSGEAAYACEADACEALAAAAATGSIACSLRWRRSGGAGFLIASGPDPEDVEWAPLEDIPVDASAASSDKASSPSDPVKDDVSPLEAPSARLHRELYRRRHDAVAIIRSRPVFCTALACIDAVQREGIPAFHPDVALAVGGTIRCAASAPAGSKEAVDAVLTGLAGRWACLVAAGGLLAIGDGLQAAVGRAAEVEALAQIYCHVLQSTVSPAAALARPQ